MQFEYPWILMLLWAAPLTGAAAWRIVARRNAGVARFVGATLQKRLVPSDRNAAAFVQVIALSLGLALAITAAARPQWGERDEAIFQRGRDVIIALDVSRSMLANDVHPNRLERAKADILDLIHELNGDRAAILAFRHKAELVCPLTTDYSFLRQALDAVTVNSAPRGETDLGDALFKALDAFEDQSSSHKAIVVISDGEDLTGSAIDAADRCAERGIPVFTVGLGSRDGGRIPDRNSPSGYQQHDGKDVISRLNHDALYEIAQRTGGAYVPVETASMTSTTLGTLYRDHLRNVTARDLEESVHRRRIDRFDGFLLPAVLLLLIAAALSRGRLKTRPRAAAAALLGLMLLHAAPARAQDAPPATNPVPVASETFAPGREGAWQAQRLYRKGRHEEAARAYMAAAAGATRKSQRDFKYNAALAWYAAGNYEQAAGILQQLVRYASDSTPESSRALGAAHYRQAHSITNLDDAAGLRESADALRDAADSFRAAARQDEDGTTAVQDLVTAYREWQNQSRAAREAELMETYGGMPPMALISLIRREQEQLVADVPGALTNGTPAFIMAMDELSERQRINAERWIPARRTIAEALSQQTAAEGDQEEFFAFLDTVQARMDSAARQLADLDADAGRDVEIASHGTYQVWKILAPYEALLGEGLKRQTNSIDLTTGDAVPRGGGIEELESEQAEALMLTQLFSDRFTNAVPPEGTVPPQAADPAATNVTGITPETRTQIVELAEAAVRAQQNARQRMADGAIMQSLTDQRSAYRSLETIRDLLPKPPQQQQQQNPQQQQQQNPQDQQNQNQEQQDQEQQNQEQEQQPQPDPASQEEEQSAEQPEAEEQEPPDPGKMNEDQVRRMLEKALSREREHREEKERQRSRIPLSPLERDW